jgi:hypothetical protein
MAQLLTNILALDFTAATGEADGCCTVVKSSTGAASDDHFAKRGVYGWQVQIGTGACPPCRYRSRGPFACRLPGRGCVRSGLPQPRFRTGRPMRDAAKNIDAAKVIHYSNNC